MNPRKHSRQRCWQHKKKLAKRLQYYLHSQGFTYVKVRAHSKGNATTRLPVDFTGIKAFYGSAGQ